MQSFSNSVSASQALEFLPPTPPGFLRAILLALLAHLLLVVALTFGVSWRHSAEPVSFDAELWSQIPQQAAPTPVEVLPAVAIAKPEPVAKKEAPPPAMEPNIVTERQKKRLAEEKLRAKQELEAEALKKANLRNDKEKVAQEARQQELQRQENIKRMAGLANSAATGSGPATSTGSATQSSGPSPDYGKRIAARILRNVVFADEISGNPLATVEVRTSPDGSIIGRKLIRSSGSAAWDEAVLKAIDKTEVLPLDTNGRIPSVFPIDFTPKNLR